MLLGKVAETMLHGKNAHYLRGIVTEQFYMISIYYVTRHSYMVTLQSYLRYFTWQTVTMLRGNTFTT